MKDHPANRQNSTTPLHHRPSQTPVSHSITRGDIIVLKYVCGSLSSHYSNLIWINAVHWFCKQKIYVSVCKWPTSGGGAALNQWENQQDFSCRNHKGLCKTSRQSIQKMLRYFSLKKVIDQFQQVLQLTNWQYCGVLLLNYMYSISNFICAYCAQTCTLAICLVEDWLFFYYSSKLRYFLFIRGTQSLQQNLLLQDNSVSSAIRCMSLLSLQGQSSTGSGHIFFSSFTYSVGFYLFQLR